MEYFLSLGHYLQVVADAAHSTNARQELLAAAGNESAIPAEGGFLVPDELAADLAERVYATGEVLQRTTRLEMQSRRLRVPVVDESNRADGSRFGAVSMAWLNDGDTITASQPKFGQRLLEAKKVAGLVYTSNELLGDAAALESIFTRIFSLEAAFQIEDAVVNGTGAGQPLGVLKSNALITVSKEATQAANTILTENIVNMWARLWSASKARAVWLVNADVASQLYTLNLAAGTAVVPLVTWTEAGPLLLGRPIIEVEYCQTLGTVGDIILADLGEYLLAERTMRADLSLHVRFSSDEGAFRFLWRLDGQPAWSSPTTPKNGSSTVSPFVALEARA